MLAARRIRQKLHAKTAQFSRLVSRLLGGLRSPSAPYVVTILLAAAAWAFIYLLEALVAAPLVEYDVTWQVRSNARVIAARMDNLSRTNRIEKLVVGFASRKESPGTFSELSLYAVAPAAEGEESMFRITGGGSEAQFTIVNLQPRSQFRLRAVYTGRDTPELRLLMSSSPVYLYKSGPVTFLAKNVIYLVGFMALACVFAVGLVMVDGKRAASSDTKLS